MTCLFPQLPEKTRKTLNRLPSLIDEVFPMPGRFRAGLGRDVAELSRLLTSGREDRGASYLGKPALLSAYLRYFLPWNIYRLSRLLSSLPLELKPNDVINDLGSGPLTLAISLWISRSELREVPLEFRCLDRTALVLEAGKKLFSALTLASPLQGKSSCPWSIKTIRGEIKHSGRLSREIKGKPASLSAAVNLYNELFWDFSPHAADEMERFTENQAKLLSQLTESSGSILVVEPGIPRSGEFISLLRSCLINKGRPPLSPCVHQDPCPLPGRQSGVSHNDKGSKAKWCHFAFDTEDAPEELHQLSAAAHIPKERAVLSFIFAGPRKTQTHSGTQTPGSAIRIISDLFPVEKSGWGRYGCSKSGLVLVSGSHRDLETSPSGSLETIPLVKDKRDAKSGALVAEKKPRS